MIFVIFISLLIILFSVLFVPIKISVTYNRKIDVYINCLFFKINLVNKTSKKKEIHHENGSIFKKIKKYINSFTKIIENREIIIKIIKEIIKNINFEKACVEVEVSSSEAKDCAMNFYYIRTFTYYFINLFEIKNNIKVMNISIFPLFLKENSKIRLDLGFKFLPISIVYAVIKSLIITKFEKH